MSFWKKVFRRKAKKISLSKLTQKLIACENMLIDIQSRLELRIKREDAIAKKNVLKNKQVAIRALQRKKQLERQLRQYDFALTTIEHQRENLEDASFNKLVTESMQNATRILNNLNKTSNSKTTEALCDLTIQEKFADNILKKITKSRALSKYNFDEKKLTAELEELLDVFDGLEIDNQKDVTKTYKK